MPDPVWPFDEICVFYEGVIDPDGSVPDDADGGFMPAFYVRRMWGVRYPGSQWYREGSPKTYARGGVIVTEKDDCPEFVGRAYTRDENGKVKRIEGGTVLLREYTNSPHPSRDVETQGWYGPNGQNNRTTQIDHRENDDGSGEYVVNLRKPGFDDVKEAVRFHAQESTGNNIPISVMKNGAGGAVRRRIKFGTPPPGAQVLYIEA